MKKGIVMVLFVLVVIVGFGSYFLVKYDFEKVKEVKSIENNYDADFEYEIEDVAYYYKDIVITGWLAETNSTNQYINRKIVLKDKSGNIISIKTEMQEREDLEGKNTVETNYIKCGLIGRVNNDKLIEGEKYQIGFIIVNQDEREKMIFIDKFIEIS